MLCWGLSHIEKLRPTSVLREYCPPPSSTLPSSFLLGRPRESQVGPWAPWTKDAGGLPNPPPSREQRWLPILFAIFGFCLPPPFR